MKWCIVLWITAFITAVRGQCMARGGRPPTSCHRLPFWLLFKLNKMNRLNKLGAVVSSTWLKSELKKSSNIRLLDTSWSAVKSGREDYMLHHIPGAQFYDLNKCVNPTTYIPRELPDPDCYTEYLRSLGISNDNHVVVYDRSGMTPSARAWWTMRAYGVPLVSVLHGGLSQWEQEGNDVTDKQPEQFKRGDFTVEKQDRLIKYFSDMKEFAINKKGQLIDTRKEEDYLGQNEEPTSSTVKALEGWGMPPPSPSQMQSGHVPGSINLSVKQFLKEGEDFFKEEEKMKKVFTDAGVDLEGPLTTMCYTGNQASLMALATAILGKKDTSVYYGSWTDYAQRAGDDIVTKATRGPAGAA